MHLNHSISLYSLCIKFYGFYLPKCFVRSNNKKGKMEKLGGNGAIEKDREGLECSSLGLWILMGL